MSNRNYQKIYDEHKAETTITENVSEAVVNPEPVVEPVVEVWQMSVVEPAEPEVITPVEEPEQAAIVSAIVVDCAKLNVREEPSPKADVVAVIDASNEVVVYDSESFGNYYKVCTAAGIEGYCVKDYLQLK